LILVGPFLGGAVAQDVCEIDESHRRAVAIYLIRVRVDRLMVQRYGPAALPWKPPRAHNFASQRRVTEI